MLKINMTSPESLLPGKCETKEISLTAKSFLNNTISGDWEYGTFTMNWISGGKPGLPVVGFKNEHVLVSSENVTVSWSPFPGAESYTVYTFLAESIDYKNPTNILEAKKNYAIVTNLKNGTNYRFIVVAIVDNQEFHSSNLIARPGIPIKSKMFAIGDHHGCAVLFDERVLCWGANSEGQVGDGSKTTWSLPAFVQNLKNEPIASISALRNQTCVNYKDSKQKQCWGSIDGVDHPRPNLNLVQPQSLKLEKLVENSLQNGKNFACIMNQENHILCWGDNQFGQLGNGSGHFSSIPLFVTN
ncbi:hypothetical protein K2X05_14130 [bacterium]|nr:hypothetical protein [bacterium]